MRRYEIATTKLDGFTYEEYKLWCKENGTRPKKDGSQEFYDWRVSESRFNFECDMDNIKCFEAYNVPVMVTGTLGLWDGRHEIVPTRKESVHEAIEACFGRSINDIVVSWVDGEIVVRALHHDGTNVFSINALSEDGQKSLPYLYE